MHTSVGEGIWSRSDRRGAALRKHQELLPAPGRSAQQLRKPLRTPNNAGATEQGHTCNYLDRRVHSSVTHPSLKLEMIQTPSSGTADKQIAVEARDPVLRRDKKERLVATRAGKDNPHRGRKRRPTQQCVLVII